jgi:HlyD family secretion protein
MMQSIKKTIGQHKIASVILLVILVYGSYWGYGKLKGSSAQTTYVLSSVTKGTITSSVSGTGQVSAFSQVDVKAQASANIDFIGAANGQKVKAGALLVHLDTTDADKTVRDARVNLDSAKLALSKLNEPPDALTSTQTQNALTEAQQTKANAQSDLAKAYDDGFTTISNAFLDLPTVNTGLQSILYDFSYTQGQRNIDYYFDHIKNYDDTAYKYRDSADSSMQLAQTAYNKNFLDYKAASRYSDPATIDALLSETYDTTKTMAEATKNTDNYLSLIRDKLTQFDAVLPTLLSTHQSTLTTLTGTTNTNLQNLLNIINTIKNSKEAIQTSDLTIKEKQDALDKMNAGTDPLDVQSAQLTIKQRQNSLTDSLTNLENYSITAPFDGIVTNLSLIKGQPLSSGATVATLITSLRLATISLNEVDVAKIKLGDKATITFDAIPDLTIAGVVQDIDMIGAVSQGVVTYNVKIGFDTQDDRVKVGMSVSASIITDVHQDVLLAPNSAVKSQGTAQYVEMFDQAIPSAQAGTAVSFPTAPRRQIVQTGLADDNFTEITSGLNEGDQVVTKTNSAAKTTTTATSAPSLLPTGGGGTRSGGGGGFRPGG